MCNEDATRIYFVLYLSRQCEKSREKARTKTMIIIISCNLVSANISGVGKRNKSLILMIKK